MKTWGLSRGWGSAATGVRACVLLMACCVLSGIPCAVCAGARARVYVLMLVLSHTYHGSEMVDLVEELEAYHRLIPVTSPCC